MSMTYAQKLEALQNELTRLGADAYLLPVGDEFLSEFPPASARRVEWLTGFTGSAGTVVITEQAAMLFTDGRYTLQAAAQLDDSLYAVADSTKQNPIYWLVSQFGTDLAHASIMYDPALFSDRQISAMEILAEEAGHTLRPLKHCPIDRLWKDRPEPPATPIEIQELRYAGQCSHTKRVILCEKLAEEGIASVFLSAPDSIAWLLNIRATDTPHTPLPLSIAWLRRSTARPEGEITLFLDATRVSEEVKEHLGEQVELQPLEELPKLLRAMPDKIPSPVWVDPATTPAVYVQWLEDEDIAIYEAEDPCQLPKACKNEVEIVGAQKAHNRDGVALTRFLCWLQTKADLARETEYSVGETLRDLRAASPLFTDVSFDSIVGFAANGAIVHYRAPESGSSVLGHGLLLVDSGGQYRDGTTDVTRTVALGGEPTDEQKDRFTRVLKGHIRLARAVFPAGTRGSQLDTLARYALWQVGVDYAHGTGHGVGSYLGVHEGPQRISARGGDVPLQVGMVLSNEPGYYKQGEYGIRIENLMHVVERSDIAPGFLGFETLTMAPIDHRLIAPELLTEQEKHWLNAYHSRVYSTLAPELPDDTKAWLKEVTAAV